MSIALNDTIAAVATPPGVGGIAVIRVSGPDAWAAAASLCANKHDSFLPVRDEDFD